MKFGIEDEGRLLEEVIVKLNLKELNRKKSSIQGKGRGPGTSENIFRGPESRA